MGIIELLGLAGSVSLLSGWRLYLTVFVTGLAMRLQWISLPENLQMLDALANPWVLGISAVGALAEFFADKILWLDSAWDTIHTVIRPIGGALLALAVVDASDPAWQVVTFLLGGGAALMSHGAKAGARALVNTSPEPVSNAVVSTGEDIATGGLLILAFSNPILALAIALILLSLCSFLVYKGYRLWRKIVSSGS
ncbi:Putative transmembrane protein [hydrothermal vent metagenome]|uniref:Transmembrane protein n=1 Tax=hydrothermal vent metagenome TaxID=652676 RepID=A0A3B0T6V0_9ZZZZ